MGVSADHGSYGIDQGRLSEIIEGERRTQLLVEAIEEQAMRLQVLRSALPRTGIKQSIEPDLGSLMVNAVGDLVTLKLDIDNVRLSDMSALGNRITMALRTAQQRAKIFREKKFKELELK